MCICMHVELLMLSICQDEIVNPVAIGEIIMMDDM